MKNSPGSDDSAPPSRYWAEGSDDSTPLVALTDRQTPPPAGAAAAVEVSYLQSSACLLFLSGRHPIGTPGALANRETGLMPCLLISKEER